MADSFFKKYRKKLYRLFLLAPANRRYVRRAPVVETIYSADPEKLFVITVAFNRCNLIALQYTALKKYLRDPYEYFVFDNSNKSEHAEEIGKYCLDNKINYVRLPKNEGWNGMSHGFALNWIYRNLIEKFSPKRFGFIDHDLFPIQAVSINKYLDLCDAWGITTKRRPSFRPWRWRLYLFIGLAFYRVAKFAQHAPNFLPDFGVDTGGRIGLNEEELNKVPDVYDFFQGTVIDAAPGVHLYRYGGFIHFAGASGDPPESLSIKETWLKRNLQSG